MLFDKLKIWNADIKVALKEKRNIWLKNGKPNDRINHLLLQKKHTKKKFGKAVRIEVGVRLVPLLTFL
jgi:hypothetical protein